MQTLLRFTVLGIFAAAGIGVAISAARHIESSTPDDQAWKGLPPDNEKIAPDAPPPLTQKQPPSDLLSLAGEDDQPKQPKPLPGLSSDAGRLEAARQQPYQDPVAARFEFLQQRIDQVAQSATQNRLAELAAKIDQIKTAGPAESQQRQPSAEIQHLKQRIDQMEQAETQNRLALLEKKLDQQNDESADDQSEQSESEGTAVNKKNDDEKSPESTITKGEGDDLLILDLHDQDIRRLLDWFSREGNLNILASENVQGKVTARLSNVKMKTALDAILHSTGYVSRKEGGMLYVGTPEDMKRLEVLRDKIDTLTRPLNYITAADVQKLITPLLSADGVISVSSPAQVDIEASTTQTGGDSFAGSEMIFVRDYKTNLEKIEKLINDVDRRPRQIAIEAMILSVNLDHDFRHGVDFDFLKLHKNVRLVTGSPLGSLGQIDVGKGGIKFGFLDGDIGAFVDALETVGDTNVIAAPHLVCLNRQRAEIQIGDQKGFLSTTQTETATTQTVEFLDIGTLLRIRPFISNDGMIRLEVHPELSTGEVKLIGNFALPEKSVTQVTTNVMCRDGCTVVLGGLIREDLADSHTQVPILGNFPIVGKLFRRKTEDIARNEIIVLITPKIVEDPGACSEGQPCVSDLQRRQSPLHVHKMTKIAQQHYGRRYYYMARTAWNAGNVPTALRYLDLALEFYPTFHDALHLRDRIMTGDVRGAHEFETLPSGDDAGTPAVEPFNASPLPSRQQEYEARPRNRAVEDVTNPPAPVYEVP